MTLAPSNSSAATTQPEFDWLIGHSRPWLKICEVATSLQISERQVPNFFDNAAIDFVIDIKTADASRPAYRIFRPSLDRFLLIRSNRIVLAHGHKTAGTNFENRIAEFLDSQKNVLPSWQIALHLNCTDEHVVNLGSELSLDLSSPGATRCYPRTTRLALITFMQRRKL